MTAHPIRQRNPANLPAQRASMAYPLNVEIESALVSVDLRCCGYRLSALLRPNGHVLTCGRCGRDIELRVVVVRRERKALGEG